MINLYYEIIWKILFKNHLFKFIDKNYNLYNALII